MGRRCMGGSCLLLPAHVLFGILHDHSFLLLGFLCSLGRLAGNFLGINSLDDTNSHGLPHVTHSKTSYKEKVEQMLGTID